MCVIVRLYICMYFWDCICLRLCFCDVYKYEWMCMHVILYVWVRVYVTLRLYMCMYERVCVWLYMSECMCMWVCECVHMWLRVFALNSRLRTSIWNCQLSKWISKKNIFSFASYLASFINWLSLWSISYSLFFLSLWYFPCLSKKKKQKKIPCHVIISLEIFPFLHFDILAVLLM